MLAGLNKAATALDAFVRAQLKQMNLSGSELVLVGFSQGCMWRCIGAHSRRLVPCCRRLRRRVHRAGSRISSPQRRPDDCAGPRRP